ncbi:ERF2 [Symbiodinium natans]|uniref:ERF2 protein n=1 Tax=Symbiodinium natans TaxID=878477 RepID=A0A812RC92_9DINO|nr:ERF2 [Symbiodinium natans]
MAPDPIDHVVIRYECCDPNLLTFTGSCGGGNPADIAKYEVMAGARNNAGTQWSLPVSLTCAPLSLRSNVNKDKFEIPEKCSRLLPGETCEVGCGSNYILQRRTNRGTFTCQLGMNRQLAGNLPRCKNKPSGKNNCNGQAHVSTTTTTSGLPADCELCAQIGNYKDSRFEQCRFWGDPHITKSWRPRQRFNFQDTGIHRYARAARCAGDFELHVFQCQYSRGRNSVATGIAARINGNATVFISDRVVETTGGIFVEPDSGAIINDRTGVNVQSDDECVFFNVNVKHVNKNPGFLHNMKLHMFGQDITHDGICGAADLKTQYIDPNSTNTMIFTPEQHLDLCNQCVYAGGKPPRGCPETTAVPKTYTTGCEFLAPLLGIDQECTPEDDSRFAQLQDNGQNCVVYAVMERRETCNEVCEKKGSTCVAAKADDGVCRADGKFKVLGY